MHTKLRFPEFTEVCSPAVRAIHAYWESVRGDRAMPARSDLDPARIVRYLPGILLVDVRRDPFDFVYRLVGTREVAARGCDPTGMRVAQQAFGGSADEVLDNYRTVVAERAVLYDRERFTSKDGRFVVDESIFMPLSKDGAIVSMVLVYSHYEDTWRSAAAQRTNPQSAGSGPSRPAGHGPIPPERRF